MKRLLSIIMMTVLTMSFVFAGLLCGAGCKEKDKREHAYMWIRMYEYDCTDKEFFRRQIGEWFVSEETEDLTVRIKYTNHYYYYFTMCPLVKIEKDGTTFYKTMDSPNAYLDYITYDSDGKEHREKQTYLTGPTDCYVVFSTDCFYNYLYRFEVYMHLILYYEEKNL